METTTAIIILLFVVSIFSGMGGNQGYNQPSAPSGTVYQEVSLIPPTVDFAAGAENAQPAIQKFILQQRSNLDAAPEIAASIVRYSQAYDINPKLVAALIARESKFNPRAISSSGAVGLGQLLPSTAKGLGVEDPYDPDQNTRGTVRYLKSLIDRFNGKVSSAIAAYLEGPNAVSQKGGFSNQTKSYIEDIYALYQKI